LGVNVIRVFFTRDLFTRYPVVSYNSNSLPIALAGFSWKQADLHPTITHSGRLKKEQVMDGIAKTKQIPISLI
jgi:hypothetical protein